MNYSVCEPENQKKDKKSYGTLILATVGLRLLGQTAIRRRMKKYPPTAEELREWMDRKNLSNKDVAKALRLSDGRVVRVWTAKKDPRPIPYPSWYTLRHKFGK